MKKQNKNTTSASFRQLLPYVKSHGFALALSIVLAAVSVILQLYVPILFGDAIDHRRASRGFCTDVAISAFDSFGGYRFCAVHMAHESAQQSHDLSHRAGHSFPRHSAYSKTAALISGQAQLRRHCQPHHHRYRCVIGRTIARIYPAVFRYHDHSGDAGFHVLQKFLDFSDGHCADPAELSCRPLYLQPFVSFVPEAK